MIKAIIFDCFGVLYRDNVSMLYEAVSERDQQALQDIIHATDHGFLSRHEYYEKIAELAGKTVDEIQAIERKQHSRDEAMVAYSQTFRPGLKIGMLSNIDEDTMSALFPEPERSQLFDAFVMSGAVGLVKPNVEIFQYAAAQLGLHPEECIMVDDLMKNVEGAELAGMHGLLFTTHRQLQIELTQLLTEVV